MNEPSPYASPNTTDDSPVTTATPAWRQRRYAFAFTLLAIFLSSAAFSLLFNNAPGDKPIFFCRMLLGPFARILEAPLADLSWSSIAIVVPPTFAYTLYPCCLSAIVTVVGVFFWWGCGVVAATGGV